MFRNRVISNAYWIIGCRIFQAVLTLVINVLIARYLGPANFGTLNYAASIVSFFLPIMQLGFNSILVKKLVASPEREGIILGTSLVLNLISACVCIFSIAIMISILNPGEKETLIVGTLYSLVLISQAIEMIQYWFQAKLLSKYTAIITLVAYGLVSAYRICLLIANKGIYWFAIVNALDYMIIAISLLLFYKKLGGTKFSFSLEMAKELILEGRFFIVSSLMITIFSSTDRVMLKVMIDDTVTGYYSAAVSCSLLTNFLFTAILDTAKPVLFECKNQNQKKFEDYTILLFSIINILSIVQCIGVTLLSKYIIYILYGVSYAPSVNILRLVVWYTTFSYLGTVRNIWIVAENKQKYLWIINLFGAVLNIVLNLIFIKIIGGMGAALASLVTQFFTNVFIVEFIKPLRESNKLLFKSLDMRRVLKFVKEKFLF